MQWSDGANSESKPCMSPCPRSIHPFKMRINEVGTEAELVTVERPLACAVSRCKCCSYSQRAHFTSGGNVVGSIKETFYCCVPSFKMLDVSGAEVYLLHSPTCCCGMCTRCCDEDDFWIFDAAAKSTNGGKAEHVGKILKTEISVLVDELTDASAFEVHFPATSTVEQKASLVGSALFLNAIFFQTRSALIPSRG
jgi:Scramblase